MASNCNVVFSLPVDFAVISRACQPITHLQLFTREDTLKKSVIDEPAHVAIRLQLLEMSSITTPNKQF